MILKEEKIMRARWLVLWAGVFLAGLPVHALEKTPPPVRPNFLFIITDDQSWALTPRAGYHFVSTPVVDQIANEGLYFKHGYVSAPSCTGSRASVLSGRHVWNVESAAMISGKWPEGLRSYQDLLGDAGYFTGSIGKGWGPGILAPARNTEPAGRAFNDIFKPDYKNQPEWTVWDLDANLNAFLDAKPEDAPFSLWLGSFEPHRPYVKPDTSRFEGKDPKDFMPGFFPDTPDMRKNLSSYLIEVEHFDKDLAAFIKTLEKRGVLHNTIIIITSDNGADLPRAKPQNYDFGVHVPFVVRWGKGITQPGRTIDDMVSLVDVAPTLLDYAGVVIPKEMPGKSLRNIFESDKAGQVDETRTAVYTGYDRHSFWRKQPDEQTYPRRAIHTARYAYIRNYFPDRWPAGDPPVFAEATQEWLRDAQGKPVEPWFSVATAKRPREELYDLETDPAQHHNLAEDKAYKKIRKELSKKLDKELKASKDPVHTTGKDYFAQFVTPDMIQKYEWPSTKN
jgi:N-sulfoglucosamine sulfohydrolase